MEMAGVDFEETSLVGTAIYCCSDSEFLGDIVFADIIKEDSKQAIATMGKMGVKTTVMLTGDKQPIADDIAQKAGIQTVYSRLLPDEKIEKIKELQDSGNKVFYTGDGINDAPVLAVADLGIAMGAVGADVAIEASDIVIMGDSLSKIPVGIRVARKALKLAKENIAFSLVVKTIILVLVVFLNKELPMWIAVFGDVGVAIIAIVNSLRAMIVKKSNK
jgi:Cd2+/Zn2+-exporting ATPase